MIEIPANIRAFLEISIKDNLENFEVVNHEGNAKGVGFLGDFFFISLTNKKTNEAHHLAVKQALAGRTKTSLDFVSTVFRNEICFYEIIWPELRNFQNRYPNVEKFSKVSEHFAVDKVVGAEKISFENLRYKGFRNHERTEFFSKDQLEYVLRAYGQFHAISFAFRKIDPANFRNITDGVAKNFNGLSDWRFFQQAIDKCCQQVSSTFKKETEDDVIKKFKVYTERGSEIFDEVKIYDGEYPALVHGDCWSNNIMFKYDEHNNIRDLRLIDFQLITLGTVVHDLSYCIYASSSKEIIDDLDHYLRIYYRSLSQSLRGYGLDPELVYSYDVLQLEWKKYSKFGLIMGLLVNAAKFSDWNSVPDLAEMIDNEMDENRNDNDALNMRMSEMFLDIGRSLVLHAYKNGFL